MRMKWFLSTVVFFLPLTSLLAGEMQTFSSGSARVSLIELYTSEGCSSCPSAEAWLTGLRTDANLWKTFIPIAFHVTYWNNLGWVDAASQDTFTERQRAYSNRWHASSIYTPCFVRNGNEWHRDGELSSSNENTGVLTVGRAADGKVEVGFQTKVPGHYEVWLAVIGGQIETQVRAGENAGRKLRHDFVALSLQHATLDPGATLRLPAPGKNPPREIGLVAWVTKVGDSTPIQAAGGWLNQ